MAAGSALPENSTAAPLPFLFSRVLPIGTGTLAAAMYALAMEASPLGARTATAEVAVGIAFEELLPQVLRGADFNVTLADGRHVPVADDAIVQAGRDARRFLASFTLPSAYLGPVRCLACDGACDHSQALLLPLLK